MPTTALSTTKRKFHKLLDSISNASSTSLVTYNTQSASSTVTLPAAASTPNKKPRVERPVSAYVPRSAGTAPRESISTTRPRSVAASQTKSSISVSGEHKTPPNFAPWDRAQFLERLKTYRHVDKWTGKPEKVNEVEWAKRGWSCVGKERVGCVGGCGCEVVIKLEEDPKERTDVDTEGQATESPDEDEDDWRDKAQEQLVEKYAEMISTAHQEGCLWRRRGCDDTIQRLPLVHSTTALESLRKRYQSLLAMASDLPPSLTTPAKFDTSKTINQATILLHPAPKPSTSPVDSTEPSPPPPPPPNDSALLLALFGWQAEEHHISGLATCSACFRRLGLWLFQKPSPISADGPGDPSTATESSMAHLDVVGEHRDYCPWINALAQNGGSRRSSLDGLAGWEVLVRAVGNARMRGGTDDEGRGGSGSAGEGEDREEGGVDGKSFVESVAGGKDDSARDERDRERWARLKKVKQVFQVKKRERWGD